MKITLVHTHRHSKWAIHNILCLKKEILALLWMTNAQRIASMLDQPTARIEKRNYTKRQLLDTISERYPNYQPPTKRYADIRAYALAHGIPVEYERNKVKEGWLGKPKGMLQLLHERGFIDPTKNISFYTVKGKKDANGNTIQGSSLRTLVSNLPDFKKEMTLLQFRAQQLGVRIECSPKYHPEIAGEGIEYCWGLAKNAYRRFPLSEKRTREKFRMSVEKSLDTNTILTKTMIRKLAKRQRRYILAYLGLDAVEYNGQGESPKMSCQLIERLVKVYKQPHKCHRNILDQEKRFLLNIVDCMKNVSKSKPIEIEE